MKKIVVLAASQQEASINRKLLCSSIEGLPHEVIMPDLRSLQAPVYSEDREAMEGIPANIQELFSMMGEADGFIIASPEHNGLPPAFFKNTIDWLSRIDQQVFRKKPVLIMSTSPGKLGGRFCLDMLKQVMPRWGGEVVAEFSLPSFHEHFDDERRGIKEPFLAARLRAAVNKFLAVVESELEPTLK